MNADAARQVWSAAYGTQGGSCLNKEARVCDLQDLTVLLGLGANFLFGWLWADQVAALGLIPS